MYIVHQFIGLCIIPLDPWVIGNRPRTAPPLILQNSQNPALEAILEIPVWYWINHLLDLIWNTFLTHSNTSALSVCLYWRILLTAEPIWFSFSMKLLIGPGKVYNYLRKIPPLSQEIKPLEKSQPRPKVFLLKKILPLTSQWVSRGVAARSDKYNISICNYQLKFSSGAFSLFH